MYNCELHKDSPINCLIPEFTSMYIGSFMKLPMLPDCPVLSPLKSRAV